MTTSYWPGSTDLAAELLPRLRRRQRRLCLAVIGGHVLPACCARRIQAFARGEPAGLLIDGRDGELGPDPHPALMNVAAAAACEQLFLAHDPKLELQ